YWCLQLNTGHGFNAVRAMSADSGATLAAALDGTGIAFAYAGRFPVYDVDGDGRPDVLYPMKLASRICRYEIVKHQDGTSCSVNSGPSPQAIDCPVEACPEDPSGIYPLPTSTGIPIVGIYGGAIGQSGVVTFGAADDNAYVLGAVHFVQSSSGFA